MNGVPSASDHQVYMGGKSGPFRCDHCEYYEAANRCNNGHIIQLANQRQFGLTMMGAFARVEPGGCSDYFEPTR